MGLLGIGALILIYIIRPNYQQKFVTSTYVWKLSLKYKKKNLPINHIRNILIFLCQLLILIACALLLARPIIATEKTEVRGEKIVIIDASASMRVSLGDITRFERAVDAVKTLAQESAENEELLSIILADGKAHYLVQRTSGEAYEDTVIALDELLDGEMQCSYGSADMEGAVALAEEVVAANPDTEVLLYTATTYIDKGGIKVVDVSQNDEWNVAVLNCNAEIIDNFYEVTTEIGCYGKSQQITVHCDMFGVNGTDKVVSMNKTELFNNAEPEHTFVFDKEDHITYYGEYVYSCESIHVYVQENDSFADDNSFYIYGGIKPTIKIQYVSPVHCQFFRN
ncbi:MAG: VWA domain-containing protein, partial [Clostridiales bacterium]|nr:VWA domain-containing protein [Clostridiales bacterium]